MADWWTQDPIATGKGLPAAPEIEVEGPGGQVFAFPAGTGQDVMREALARHYGTPAGRPRSNAAAPAANDWWGADRVVQPASTSQASADLRVPPGADEAVGDASAAVGRGIIEGVPIAGPYLLGGVNRAIAGVRSLQNDTKFSDELARTERFGSRTASAHPIASGAGAMAGGTLATLPLVAAAPAAFGAGAGSLMVRSGASLASGAALGGADAAVRSDGDLGSIGGGAALGGALGAVGPGLGHVAGKVVGAVRGGTRGEPVLREALHGFSEADLAAAQTLREQSLNLPGGGVPLSLDEALNQVTGGRATRLSQIARVAANSGGEAGRMTGEFYAARPGQVEQTGRASFDLLGPAPVSPSALGIEAQTAARAGIAQTSEGMALTRAREAVGPRLGDDAAGQVIQRDLRATADLREAVRQGQAARDYGAARAAPENAGIERMVTVERPGEPIVTQPAYSRPQFTDAAPRPLEGFTRPAAEAGGAGPESLARFIARNGGLDLTGDLKNRLKSRQRDLIMEAAQYDTMPADSTLKRIAELENAIAAVEAVADEERSRRQR